VASTSNGWLREVSNAGVVGCEKKVTRFTIDAILGTGDVNHAKDTEQWHLSQSVMAEVSQDGDVVEEGSFSGCKEDNCNKKVIGIDGIEVVQMAAADSVDSGLVRGWHSDSTCGGDSVCPG
jgi:hypothetical protein